MSVTSEYTKDNGVLEIKVVGRFDFGSQDAFRRTYLEVNPKPKKFIVDLSETNYIDSSGLGMLLMLREYAGDAEVKLSQPNELVQSILETANFNRLFVFE